MMRKFILIDKREDVKNPSKKYNLKISNYIIGCCNGKIESSGELSDGTKLKWMYYNEYLKNNN